MRIVLCDDDQQELTQLEIMVKRYLVEIEDYTIKTYNDSDQLFFDLGDLASADLYILDIDMPGKTGVDLAEKIREVETNAIVYFYTSHIEYAAEGYRVEARRFLIKGGEEAYFKEALEYACRKHQQLMEDCVTFSRFRDVIRIPIAEILYAEREGRQTAVYTQKLGRIEISVGIKELQKEIGRPYFVLVDRGVLVNLDFIRRTDQNTVTLFGGKTLGISRSRVKEVKESMARYFHVR